MPDETAERPSAPKPQPGRDQGESLAALIPIAGSVAGIAILTFLAYRFEMSAAAVGFVYLVWVVLAAAYGGFWIGTAISIIAAACLDYFFLPPVLHWDISHPMDWVALGAFEFTALVVSRLQHRAQVKAAEARAQRQYSERLYSTAREILRLDRSAGFASRITSVIREIFELRGVVLFDASNQDVVKSGDCTVAMEKDARDAFFQNADAYDPQTDAWQCVLRAGSHAIGGLAMRGAELPDMVAQALASLCALAMERARSFESEARAEAARQAEQLRTAVVEALAHQIKTPLCVIQAASSSLLYLGELSQTQTELITSIDGQSAKLNGLVSRLLGTAALDSEEIKPRIAPVLLSRLVNAVVQSVEDPVQRGRIQVLGETDEATALVDEKLVTTAVRELIDNALKYSAAGSPVTIKMTNVEAEVRITVHDRGLVIAPADRSRIFDRFYRTAAARKGRSGTGLGLSIVKRISEAHHGRVWVESGAEEGTSFNLSLPRWRTPNAA